MVMGLRRIRMRGCCSGMVIAGLLMLVGVWRVVMVVGLVWWGVMAVMGSMVARVGRRGGCSVMVVMVVMV